MVKKRFIDPFFPNRPVNDPDKFSGRTNQIDEIIDSLFQVANNNPKHTIITGERGMGKSSLLLQTKLLANGDNRLSKKLAIDMGYEKFDFIHAWHDANYDQTVDHIVYGLLRDLESSIQKIMGKFSLEIDFYGIKLGSPKEERETSITDLVNMFCGKLEKSYKAVTDNKKQGIILFIDELDRVKPESGIATFFKLCTEKLNRDNMTKVAFFCAGITGAIQNLEGDHASIFRTFRDVPIPILTLPETSSILTAGFESAGFTYEAKVIKLIYHLSAGFPEPVHILGSEMLSVCETGILTEVDYINAKTKVVTDVRRNKLKSLLENAGYGKYQLILDAMSKHDSPYVPIENISELIGYDQNQFSTNMSNLIKRGTITRVDKGVYSFVDPLLKEYIKNFGIIKINKDEKKDEDDDVEDLD